MYLCIDMRSFFASVECSLRGLDPLNVPLAVVDASRGDGALIMAATPKLKEYGVPSRCRLFEIPKDIFFIKAKPRMRYYIYFATKIHSIFLRYVSPEDCYVYSVDESFLRIDEYISHYGSAKAMAFRIMEDIKKELGIFSTCGAGDNMYLSKISLDIMAKKNKGYFYLTEKLFKELLWNHKPITDFWMIASGISSHLARLNMYTMKDIAHADPYLMKKEFGVLGAQMQMHALGKEEAELDDVISYTPVNKSISRSQIFFRDYTKQEALIPLLEMAFLLCIKMCMDNVDAKSMVFFVGYTKSIGGGFSKNITLEYRLRDYEAISKIIKNLYATNVLELPIRSIGISFSSIRPIHQRQLSLFYTENGKYVELSKTIGFLHEKFGKNSCVPAIALLKSSTMLYRNGCIGGHNGE